MEELFPWSNINHHQQEIEESIIFGSENTFLNPIQDLPKPDSSQNITSSFGSASQYWRQTLTVNRLHKGNNVIPLTTTTAATNTNFYNTTSPDLNDGISVIFSDQNNSHNKVYKNFSDVVSDNSVTKVTSDDGDDSSGFYEHGPPRTKRPRSDPGQSTSSVINFLQYSSESEETDSDVITQMKQMIYTAAAFRPVSFSDEEAEAEKPKRKNVRISNEPQTVAARKRREKISERIRVLQKLVPGGDKMDTASMLDEAANYLKFLRSQVKAFEPSGNKVGYVGCGTSSDADGTSENVIRNVALGVPFPMQGGFLLPYQQIYPNMPPA